MIFEIETMEPKCYPVGTIHTILHWNAENPIQRTGKVIAHKPPMPANCMASFPRVIFEEIK